MRALLDTHSFLWAVTEPDRLSERSREILFDGDNEIFLSVVSAWEVVIKHSKNHLALPGAPDLYIPECLRTFNFRSLDVTLSHAMGVSRLPMHHRDPFDRLLIAQSLAEKLPILTSDTDIARYDVEVIW